MKKVLVIISAACLLISCGDNGEKKAQEKLTVVTQLLEKNDFALAKQEIDSIKVLYPKAFNARKEANQLLLQVELKEQETILVSLDSLLQEKQKEFEAIEKNYKLEKDAEYQEIGNYFWPSQTVEKNLNRSYLRFQVNERGEMAMTSIYSGANSIRHYAVKVSAPDKTFAETPRSNDIYETSVLDQKIEKADYKLGQDGDVIPYIYENRDNNLKVEFIGDRKFNTTMSKPDREALTGIYELAQILSSIENTKNQIKETQQKIAFYKGRIESAKANPEL